MAFQKSELRAGKPSTKYRQRAHGRPAALDPTKGRGNTASGNNRLLVRPSHDCQQTRSSRRGVQAMRHPLPGGAPARTHQAHHHHQSGPHFHPPHHHHEHDHHSQRQHNTTSSSEEERLRRDAQGYPTWLPSLRSLPLNGTEDFALQLDWLHGHVVHPLHLPPIDHRRAHKNRGFNAPAPATAADNNINNNNPFLPSFPPAAAACSAGRRVPTATPLEVQNFEVGLHTWMDWQSPRDLTTSDWMMRGPYRGYVFVYRGRGCSGQMMG